MKRKFSTISSIELDNPNSWLESCFITLDMEWCHDDVLAYSINLLEKADVSATWFITHDTPMLHKLRDNPNFELGIHPNFNPLLEGDYRNGKNAEEVIDRLMNIVPEAKSVRSHSLTQSSKLLGLYKKKGLQFDCNDFVPFQEGINVKPYRLWNEMIKVPHIWEDDISCVYGGLCTSKVDYNTNELCVFDFHPIHIFINSFDLSLYESTKEFQSNPDEMYKKRWQKDGTQTWLENLLNQ